MNQSAKGNQEVSDRRKSVVRRRHRIVFVTGQLGAGGLEKQLFELLQSMDRDAYSPAVIPAYYQPGDRYFQDILSLGVPIYRIQRCWGSCSMLRQLRRFAGNLVPEVMHALAFQANFAVWYAMLGRPGLAVGGLRGSYWRLRQDCGWLKGGLCSRFPGVMISNSLRAQTEAASHDSLSAPYRVEYVPNAVVLPDVPPVSTVLRERFEIAGIGRLFPIKAWEVTLRAAKLFGETTGARWRLRVCGTGPCLGSLQQVAAELGIGKSVEFLGFEKDVPSFLATSHALILSSRSEGSPNAVTEAMAAGRPVVATAVGDVPFILRDGVDGYVTPVDAPDAMAAALVKLWASPDLCQRMGDSARKRVDECFSIDAVTSRTLGVYARLIDSGMGR